MEMFSLATDYGLIRSTGFKTHIQPLGGKYEQRISKSTTERMTYKLKFTNRLTADMNTYLWTFYKARKADFEKFNIVDPFNSATLTVRFKNPTLDEEFFMHLVENSEVEIIEVN